MTSTTILKMIFKVSPADIKYLSETYGAHFEKFKLRISNRQDSFRVNRSFYQRVFKNITSNLLTYNKFNGEYRPRIQSLLITGFIGRLNSEDFLKFFLCSDIIFLTY